MKYEIWEIESEIWDGNVRCEIYGMSDVRCGLWDLRFEIIWAMRFDDTNLNLGLSKKELRRKSWKIFNFCITQNTAILYYTVHSHLVLLSLQLFCTTQLTAILYYTVHSYFVLRGHFITKENRIYIRVEFSQSLGVNFVCPFQPEREFKVYKSCKFSQIICSWVH